MPANNRDTAVAIRWLSPVRPRLVRNPQSTMRRPKLASYLLPPSELKCSEFGLLFGALSRNWNSLATLRSYSRSGLFAVGPVTVARAALRVVGRPVSTL